jgi:hypothetical protein
MTEEEALRLLESLTVGERKAIPLEDFAWPEERKFPCDTQDHLDACARLLGHAPENKQADIKARAIRIAKQHGFTLPDSWKAETTESGKIVGFGRTLMGLGDESIDSTTVAELAVATATQFQKPQKKIGTLPICWLEYNARSLNGRIYPKATCDAIFQAAQRKLADPDALPPTTFVSHEAANGNVNTHLVGGPRKVWQEGSKFWANIDLADMSVARDMLGLAEGGYLKSGSMRVLGVELRHDRNYDLPLVVVQEGAEVEFLGIDLTTRPGLDKIARIPQVLYEADGREPYVESFDFEILPVEKEEHPPAMPLPIFIQIALGALQEDASKEAHMRVHDHLAGVMDAVFGRKHGNESARAIAGIKEATEARLQLDEAGRAIAMKHATRLIAAHDEAAHACGMECEGCYASSDTDNDGDDPAHGYDPDNDGESRQKETPLTEEEMLAALKAKGFTIEAPKTADEKLAALEARLAAQDAKLAQLTESAQPTQRQTLAQSQFSESTLQPEPLYEDGDYLKGELHPKNWRALSNSQVPWPADLDPNLVLAELSPFLEFQLLTMQEAAAGRSLRDQITLGLLD